MTCFHLVPHPPLTHHQKALTLILHTGVLGYFSCYSVESDLFTSLKVHTLITENNHF